MTPAQEKILNIFRYVPAGETYHWTPALLEADIETLEYALEHCDDERPTLGKTKIVKIERRLAQLKKQQVREQSADRAELSEIESEVLAYLRAADKPLTVGKIRKMYPLYAPGIPDVQAALQTLIARGLVRHYPKPDSDHYGPVLAEEK